MYTDTNTEFRLSDFLQGRVSGSESKSSVSFHADYSSWLNQVETWFSKVEREVIARGSSHPWLTCHVNSANTFVRTASRPNHSAGPTLTPAAESDLWLRYDRDSPLVLRTMRFCNVRSSKTSGCRDRRAAVDCVKH